MSSRSGHHMLGFKCQFQNGRPSSHLGWIRVMNFNYAHLQAQPSSLHLVSCLHLLWVWRSSGHKKFNMAARQPFWNEVWPKKVHWPHAPYFNNSPDRYEAIPIPRLWVIGDTKRGRTDGRTDGRRTTNHPNSSAGLRPVELKTTLVCVCVCVCLCGCLLACMCVCVFCVCFFTLYI